MMSYNEPGSGRVMRVTRRLHGRFVADVHRAGLSLLVGWARSSVSGCSREVGMWTMARS